MGPSGVLYREVPLYTRQPAGSNGVLYSEVPRIQDSQLGPSGVHCREVPLYMCLYKCVALIRNGNIVKGH